MEHIGEIGKKITVTVTYKNRTEYTDYKFSYYGTTHFIHIFEDAEGNTIVWKSTNMVEYIEDNECHFVPYGSTVELSGSVKEHSIYKDTEQTVVTRCKFKLIELAKTEAEIRQEKAKLQLDSLGKNDLVWEMPYKQYKEHYSDCETVAGSFNSHEDNHGHCNGVPTIKVIIREGRLKNSGVRGQHFSGYEFTSDQGKIVCYRAVSEENARKQMLKDFPNSINWECTRIYDHKDRNKFFI